MGEQEGKLFNDLTYYKLRSLKYSTEEEVVVCVHGIGSYHVHYEGLSAALVDQGYTVLTFDLMGRGYSPFPPTTTDSSGNSVFGADGHIEQIHELVAGLGLDQRKYHLIGHSMGGALSALYAARYGANEVLTLTLLSPVGLMDLGIVKMVRRLPCLHGIVRNVLRNGHENAIRQDFFSHKGAVLEIENKTVADALAMNRENPQIFEAFWQCVLHFPFFDTDTEVNTLAKLHHIRTMLMWADTDKAVPVQPSLQRYLDLYQAAGHPAVESKVYKNAGHAFFLEYADEFHADIISFLKKAPQKEDKI